MASDRLVQCASGLAVIAIVWSGATVNNTRIPRRLQQRVTSALQAVGMRDIQVSAIERRLHLAGPAQVRQRAVSIAGSVKGVQTVEYEIIKPASLPLTLGLSVRRRRETLTGELPDAAFQSALLDCSHLSFGVDHVVNQTSVNPGEVTSLRPLATRLCTLVGTLAVDAGRAELALTSETAVLSAEAFTSDGVDRIKRAAAALGVALTAKVQLAPDSLQGSLTELLGRSGINFAENSAVIDEPSLVVLATAIELLKGSPAAHVEIGGHADDRGDDDVNLALSDARAQSVLGYLSEFGVTADRLSAVGYGETRPLLDNATPDGRRANRRIEFTVAP